MDYVDLYQIHRWDNRTPIEETMEALHDVVRAGKARYIGASSMFAWQFAKAQHVADRNGWTRFVSMQNHYNLIYREEEREMIPLCIDQGVGVIPWSPLARGVLAGNRTREGSRLTTRADTDQFTDYLYSQPADFDVVERVAEVAAERDVPSARVALAWLLHKPGVTASSVRATNWGPPPSGRAGAEQLALLATRRWPRPRSPTSLIPSWVTAKAAQPDRSAPAARESDHRDLPCRLLRVLGEMRVELGLAAEETLALLARGHDGIHIDGLGADLDRRRRVGQKVVIPGGIRGRTPLGGE